MIVLTKGIHRSLLMDLGTADVRYMPTHAVPEDLQPDGLVEERQDPYQHNCVLELLDVHLAVPVPKNIDWSPIIATFPSIRNIRLIFQNPEVQLGALHTLVLGLHQKVMHFGISLLNFTNIPNEELEHALPGVKVISGHEHPEKEGYFMPQIWAVAVQFNNSHEHNAYHRDRVALHIEAEGLRVEPHEVWDIPKEKIAVCCDCEMRRLCYDYRKPQVAKDGYAYATECAYDPYTASWKVPMDEGDEPA